MARIDDALRRILRVKFMLGLFEHPFTDRALLSKVGSAEHRALAREAVAKTLVLLKNENNALPIAPDAASILVAGEAADDIGTQCGGWTIAWQGSKGPITAGTTILSGIRAAVSPQTQVAYSKNGDDNGQRAQVGIAVVGEAPYAEWEGDTDTPELTAADKAVIRYVRTHANIAIVVLVSGRPLIVGDAISDMDGLIAAWLPGSEGNGVADVLFGQRPFSARLSFTWPRNLKAIAARAREGEDVLYPYGYKAAL